MTTWERLLIACDARDSDRPSEAQALFDEIAPDWKYERRTFQASGSRLMTLRGQGDLPLAWRNTMRGSVMDVTSLSAMYKQLYHPSHVMEVLRPHPLLTMPRAFKPSMLVVSPRNYEALQRQLGARMDGPSASDRPKPRG